MKHVHPKTISSISHKLKNIIPNKEAEDSSTVDRVYLEHHPHGRGRRFFLDGPKHNKTIPSVEVKDSSIVDQVHLKYPQ